MSRRTFQNSRFTGSGAKQNGGYEVDRIPPLVSISSSKERSNNNELIALQSLNQSEVRSVYTVDREEADKQALELLGNALRSPK